MTGRGSTRLILASASPRRRQLLGLLGLPFDVVVADVDESAGPGESGPALARRLARSKAEVGAGAAPGAAVLAADTVVVLDGRALGKPADVGAARAMLRELRGRPHRVITGLALTTDGQLAADAVVETTVRMRRYRDEEVERYIASGGPFDKAGGYAIQDATFRPVERIVGCYPNVVGLPLCEALRALRAAGLRPAGPADGDLAPRCALCHRAQVLYDGREVRGEGGEGN